ncbi:N-acyl homoserine lactonase family protein [Peribacillus castrilensis]|uniref:Metallo-beta-lactamase family protein n=1 Tax=Peribacillus simplex TaxID=1478 RepID=A0AAN2TTI2_9BACI|nr:MULTISPECIES: N-acyl homoserine lactonase family protein [Bacillaceae]MCF7621970.1 N-acyl homoserine lactonase family protein [Peribacillus frigoritolerans]MCP1156145.1 N-acyl homoserine lactonase family protein [Peribacillus frigoritolerans]MCT1390733.1 N-acyl homoserine lactonase family protein [Peribacillus frigoritolerans]PAL11309.1 N-acyl homoserine lactonase family protein [Peribacillus simplex]PRA86337.1 N-acyl homoserine lactonase family protein [Peribacillus simplex]
MGAGVRVTAVDCGPLKLDKGIFVTGASGMISAPSSVWIIEHPKKGVILFDTGINYNVADPESAIKHWGPGMREAFGCCMTREHAIDRQLIKLGYKPNDVKYVILSHMHLDHAGGMCHFPNATFVVQKNELRYAWWPDPWTGLVYCLNDYKDTREYNFLQIDGDIDLFQDGTIKLFTTPGHSPGHQAMILRLENRGPVCLAADTGHLKEAYRNFTPMPYDWSTEKHISSYMKLRTIENAGTPIYFTHDQQDFDEFPNNGKWTD